MKNDMIEGEYAKGEAELISKYQKIGFTTNYRINQDGTKLIQNGTDDTYTPKDITIHADHRFEGMSNPADMSILYVIEANDGSKGTMVVGYGPTANLDLAEFFKAIPKENISQSKNLFM